MTLATYAELKTRVTAMLARSDLSGLVQDWVTTAEFFVFAALRVREMEKIEAALAVSSGVITVPADFIAVGELRLGTNLDIELNQLPSKQLFRHEDSAVGEGRGYWNLIGSSLHIRPTPSDSQTYWLKYLAKPVALTEASSVNAIFPAYADLYLYGTMWQAWDHVRAYDKSDREKGKLDAQIALYNERYKNEREGLGNLSVSPPACA